MHLLDVIIPDMLLVFLIHTTVMLNAIAQHNLTPFGTATQSTNYRSYNGKPEYAIEPPISNKFALSKCSHTDVGRRGAPADWWMFQFSFGIAFITDITIYYREGLARRMDGFKLCVTNTSTTPPDSDACYEDPGPGLPNIFQNISWNKLGKYVIYYDDKGSEETVPKRSDGPVVELCYVAINGCQKGFWGSNCLTKCPENCIEGNCFPGNGSCVWGCDPTNCLNDVCNKDTAVCTDGCKEGRTGKHCNKYNLASYSSVTQNPSGSLPARLAIDGNKTSCSKTQGKIVTFQVDLKKARAVTEIFVIFVEHITTVGDHIIYASNTSSSWKNGTVLYQGKAIPAEVNLSTIFRYLTFEPLPQQAFVILELCEIGVIGCPPGHYGSDCTESCPQNCQGPCHLEYGNCTFGCLSGWTGETCGQACVNGNFGTNCSNFCDGCLSFKCNRVDGLCDDKNACNAGYVFGDYCNEECSIGQFGTNCSEICKGCRSYMCDNADGLCDDTYTCNPGYFYGDYCNKACDNWYFGHNCSMECNCLAEPCNKEDGICPFGGCKEGWHGDSCSKRCNKGKFGQNCNDSCDGCLANRCEATDGLCYNTTGCKPGYYFEEYCNNTCDDWFFGTNCSRKCNCLHGPCNWFTGMCPSSGCDKGWQGESCDEGCDEGKFGQNCNDSCDGCLANRCEATDGLCYNTTGCKPGYYFEEYCNNTCDDWFFGTNCSRKCNCLHGPCNWFTGMCPSGGCDKGWQGESCDEGCDEGKFGQNCNDSCDGCISNSCDVIDGLCVNTTGCEPGYYFEKYCNNTCDDWYFGYNCTWKCYCLTEPCSRFSGKCQSGGCQKGWHGESCGEAISEFQKEDPPYAAAVGGGATAVILILLIVVVFIIYRRRLILTKDRKVDRKSSINETSFDTSKKTKNNHNYANIDSIAKAKDDTPSVTESEDTESQIVKVDDVNMYGNVLSVLKYKIMVEDLKTTIHEKQKGEDFKKEYAILQKGLLYPHVEGSKDDNKVKNRFLSLWPYDHSRVVLEGDTAYDYINASYIDNYEKEKAYIAAQGPKNETVRDFWHMIWQEKVGKVVMVTQLKENQKIKCAQYWPKSVTKPLAVNNYIVTMKEERKHTVYVYRLLTVLNKNDTNEKERKIHHFHFTQWPDHGVPDSIKLVSFYRKVKIAKCYHNGQMVVHCSAGVGRTGTFIAIDALYENGKNVGYVNVMECIEMMRKDRMNMVQTYEQYETVFEALLELFTVPETSIPKTDFCKYISDQEHKTVPRNQNMYKVEFQRLETLRPMYPQSAHTAATSKENIHKNSAKKIFPHDKYRPYLMSYGKTRNDYINAVIVPGYEEKSKLLVTQCPLEKTVVDFWTMVYDHQSNIVVLLDQLNMNAPLWLKQHEVLEFDQFSIVQENVYNPDELQLTLRHENQGERKITVFTPSESNGTSDTMLPSHIILDLLKNVNDCWEENKGPITVVCSDGCSKSGIFVALRLILEKLAIDDGIDVFQVVRTIQVRRPEFLMNFYQYEYCYKCIKDHLENESLYANV
ncbi:uncharacterized protein [Mytilus edulis]|uniref:uncharacterized protein n=1 Tax=Mytilus edulis TaxID=6550 RepID=UPI0039EF47DB